MLTASPLAEAIRIRPRAVFVPEHSDTAAGRFAFGYEVVIDNGGDQAVTLTDRHWVIDHGNGCLKEVRGEGVVGEQPRIPPGERFSYRSGAVIESPAGRMWGDYGFVSDRGDVFRVTIPTFDLIAPAVFRSIQ
ncbi:MAG: Co2+/Mg2+ efflux protein ApaG [Guyparkeria sp.]|uniref:Co2+/Mg2+ efflux protein ApaG n=1 Tax=Guyparkeria sp. TaxID=2035736 RepID=UPI003978BE7A